MSKIKNSGLEQYGAEPFEQQQFGTAGVGGVNLIIIIEFLTVGGSGVNVVSVITTLFLVPRSSLYWSSFLVRVSSITINLSGNCYVYIRASDRQTAEPTRAEVTAHPRTYRNMML